MDMKLYSMTTGLIFALLALLPACTQTTPALAWQSPLHQNHPLVGHIWRSADDQIISADQLLDAVSAADFLLLGEKHDNPDHHALQARIIDHLIATDRLAAAAFEMMDTGHQLFLDSIEAQHLTGLDQLHEQLQWDDQGWDWDYYGPLLLAALQAKVPVAAANIDAATMTRVYGEALPDHISGILNQAVTEQLNKDIDESHCGLLPESQFPAMVRVQQARDQQMASSMLIPAAAKVSLLVAGNYHIRQDLGVPNYLRARSAEIGAADVVSLAFIEVSPSEDGVDEAAYLQQFNEVRAYDYIWFTPVVSEEDYCASLR